MTAPLETASSRPTAELRRARRALRTEQAAVRRWRRLLRARLDLALAAIAPVEPIGLVPPTEIDEEQATDALDVPAGRIPMHSELTAAVLVGTAADEVRRLDRLRELDQRLAAYERALEGALADATDAYITELAADPLLCLDVLDAIR